jgi:type I restriction enzyme S subunit
VNALSDPPLVALGDIFEIARGGSPRPIDDYFTDANDGLNWVLIGDASSGSKYITGTKKRIRADGLKKTRPVKPGDFLLSNSMSFGRPYIMAVDGCIHDGGLLLRPLTDQIDQDYLYHLLGSPAVYAQFESRAGGSTVKNLNTEIVRSVQVPLPPLAEQKRIATILDHADALRRLRRRALDRLHTLGQAIFQETFGQALQGHFFEFGNVVQEFRYGTSNKSGETGLPTLRIPNVVGGRIDTTEIKTVEVTPSEKERLRLQEGDVLFVRTNGNPDYVGRCAAFSPSDVAGNGDQGDWIFASYLIRARLSERVNPVFATTYFATQIGRASVRERCKTSAGQYNVNVDGLASLPFPDVDRSKQDAFAKSLSAVDRSLAPAIKSSKGMDKLFSSLQERAFQGAL